MLRSRKIIILRIDNKKYRIVETMEEITESSNTTRNNSAVEVVDLTSDAEKSVSSTANNRRSPTMCAPSSSAQRSPNYNPKSLDPSPNVSPNYNPRSLNTSPNVSPTYYPWSPGATPTVSPTYNRESQV